MSIQDLFSLKGKTVVITGGFGDIGLSMAEGLAAFGADIALLDLQSPSLIKNRIERIEEEWKTRIKPYITDVTDHLSVEKTFASILKDFETIDILLNGAGIIVRGSIKETEEEDWDRVMAVNLKGVFLCTRAVASHMMGRKEGKIINIASTNAQAGVHHHVAYCSSKGGVIAFTLAMAIEWAPYGIQVNAINPNVVRTKMTEDRLKNPEEERKSTSRIPLGRLLEPEDFRGAAIFLSSSASNMITGHVLNVDGGYMAK